jgi:Holliday junction DNA helicase RuvB
MGEPVGLSTLAGILDTDPRTIEEEKEGYLMRAGLISRTPRGRVALPAAWEHLGTRLGVAS